MKILYAFLFIEDILLLIGVGAFLSQRQRSYSIVGIVLLVVILLANILPFRGYDSWFIFLLPAIACSFISSLARAFLPSPRVPINPRVIKVMIPFSLVLLSLLALLLIAGTLLYFMK